MTPLWRHQNCFKIIWFLLLQAKDLQRISLIILRETKNAHNFTAATEDSFVRSKMCTHTINLHKCLKWLQYFKIWKLQIKSYKSIMPHVSCSSDWRQNQPRYELQIPMFFIIIIVNVINIHQSQANFTMFCLHAMVLQPTIQSFTRCYKYNVVVFSDFIPNTFMD